jgi:hypothetical protein
MRAKAFPLLLTPLLAFAPLPGFALDRWVYLGDVKVQDSPARGRLSVNLDSLRKRARHYEIWERIVVEEDPRRPAATGTPPEQMTLWAIRCRFGEMAKVTSGSAGSFEPRAEPLRFYSPRPGSPGAGVIEATCAEARRLAAELRALQPQTQDRRPNPFAPDELQRPPSIFDENAFEFGEE